MRQNRQSDDDTKLRVALENMRYKACTPDDILFLRTRISCNVPGRPSICQESFRNVSIITGTNLHKDEINRLGALRFACETGQSLTNFFSEDSPRATQSDSTEQGRRVKRVSEITDEMRAALWSQPPSSTDKHIAGKLSLCIGMPVMIRYNYATEICMTRGQEGFVHGWQSKKGSNGQLVLDTLFVKLKDPPTCVKVPGLPENIVPVYPTTTNIDAMLPNDEKFHIARTQVEVLINFAMTDFASQGKTRPWNVCDLNNLRTHQSYYTALSRSATADGTLILQGFDPKVITGRCSGSLRQEFRELELLDEITRLRHLRKLPLTIAGDTRNNLICAFREWKGEQYVPHNVHPSIRWSKSSPWLESEVLKLDERLEMLERRRQKTKKFEKKEDEVLINSSMVPVTNKPGSLPATKSYGILSAPDMNRSIQGKSGAAKRRRSSGNHVQRSAPRKASSTRRDLHAATKRKIDQQSQQTHAGHYEAPIGCRWSQNSCAYDSFFTPLFVLWCSNREYWARSISGMGNAVADLLLEGFSLYERGEASLEDVRDDVRRLIARSRNGAAFGCYTSIEDVCNHTLSTNTVISERYYVCPNGHHVHHSNNYDAFLSAGVHEYESIAQWVSTETHHAYARCQICAHAVNLKLRFRHSPPLLVFSISRLSIHIDTTIKILIENSDNVTHHVVYTLAAVIYYANSHFTAQIITRDGRIWFYDGMKILDPNIQPTLEYVGTIHSQINMHVCRGGEASAFIYVVSGMC